jgi:hypothetical protein
MAFPTLALAVVFLGAYALYRYWDTSRRHAIPKALKPLPGPKGKVLFPTGGNPTTVEYTNMLCVRVSNYWLDS